MSSIPRTEAREAVRTVQDPFTPAAEGSEALGLSLRDDRANKEESTNTHEGYTLIVPHGATLPQHALTPHVVNDLTDLGVAVRDEAAVICFPNVRVLSLALEFAKLFRLKPLLLTGVPDTAYDGPFTSVTAGVKRYNWSDLLDDQQKNSAQRLLASVAKADDDADPGDVEGF